MNPNPNIEGIKLSISSLLCAYPLTIINDEIIKSMFFVTFISAIYLYGLHIEKKYIGADNENWRRYQIRL